MQIDKDTVVTLHYKVLDIQGRTIEAPKEPMDYLHGGYGNIFPKIEATLQSQEAGFQAEVHLGPDEAFGHRDEALVQTISRKDFPSGVKVGGQLRGRAEDGREQVFTVKKIKGDSVFLDGNHPLAGQALRFQLKVAAVRLASGEEISHGHAHGAHGHHH